MRDKELAFIVKRFYPQKNKIIILSRNYGKIDVIAQPIKKADLFWPGMLISFDLNKIFSSTYQIENTDILFTPAQLELFDQNICFYYQFLELFYYFVPLNKPFDQGFIFLYNYIKLYNYCPEITLKNKILHKIYLLKFFELIGFYPNSVLIKFLDSYKKFQEFFIDFDKEQKVDSFSIYIPKINSAEEKMLDNWIICCLKESPYFKSFKTFNL